VQHLASFPVFIGAPLFIGVLVALAVAGGIVAQRYLPKQVLADHNEIAGFVFAVVGVVYAVLLAFFAIGVWQRYQGAEERVFEEASRLNVVYRKVDLFSSVHLLRSELRQYVTLVIHDDWPKMRAGGYSERANVLLRRVAYQVRHLDVITPAQQNVHAAMMDSLDAALVDRDERHAMGAVGVNSFLWGILLFGGAATVGFSYLFAYTNRLAQTAIIGSLAFSLALVLYLIAAVDYPFRGEVSVGPEAFVHTLETFQHIGP
jgi:hypothetical protein